MAISYSTLFENYLGKGGYLIHLVNEFRGAAGLGAIATDLPTEWEDFVEQFDGGSDTQRGWVDGMLAALAGARSGLAPMQAAIRTAARQTLIGVVHADNPLPEQTLEVALAELIRQMLADSESVDANAVGHSVAASGNDGDGAVLVDTRDGHGRTLEYTYDEDLEVAVTDTSTSGSEQLRVRGEEAVGDKLSYLWPAGSGSDVSHTAIDAAGSLNLLSNGTFETYTVANTPDDWTIVVGAAGTDVLAEASVVYAGSKALELVGDSSTLIQLTQDLTLSDLASKTPYGLCLWLKADVVPAAGVLVIDLYDGSGVIDDEEGAAQSFSIDLTAISTSFVAHKTAFRLPEPLPATVTLRLRLSTAVSTGSSLFLDHLSFAATTQQYAGGPFLGFFSGAGDWSLDDRITITPTNDYGGLFQNLFWRLFDMPALGLILPSDAGGSETIDDAAIA